MKKYIIFAFLISFLLVTGCVGQEKDVDPNIKIKQAAVESNHVSNDKYQYNSTIRLKNEASKSKYKIDVLLKTPEGNYYPVKESAVSGILEDESVVNFKFDFGDYKTITFAVETKIDGNWQRTDKKTINVD